MFAGVASSLRKGVFFNSLFKFLDSHKRELLVSHNYNVIFKNDLNNAS